MVVFVVAFFLAAHWNLPQWLQIAAAVSVAAGASIAVSRALLDLESVDRDAPGW
jgi:hypothetical protein